MATLLKNMQSQHVMYSNIIPLVQTDDKAKSKETSYQQAMMITYQMLMAIAINMGEIGKGFNEIQSDQASVSKTQADETSKNTQKYLEQVAAAAHESFWSKFADAFKWIGLALAAVVGALLCETPAGFAMLALVIGLTASGLLNKGISLLGDAIGEAIGNKTAGNIMAQILGIVVITIATCGADTACSIAIASRAAAQAADTGVTVAAEAGEQAVETAIAEVASETAEGTTTALTNTTSDVASAAEKSVGDYIKASLKGYSTRSVFVNTLCSSNLIGEVIQQMMRIFPGKSDAEWKQITEAVATAIATIAVAIFSMQGMSENTPFISKFINMVPKLRTGIFALQGVTSVVGDTAQAGNSWENYLSAEIQKGEAPLKKAIDESQEASQALNELSKVMHQAMESMMKSLQPIFSINFGAGWQAAAQGLA